jgi:NADH-quinone oxidoreductase subunit J
METWLFYLFAGVALMAAINVLAQKRVFYSALSLIVCLGALAGIYLILEAPFIAAVQVIVYAGAIMVLFLLVIMLLDPFSASALQDKKKQLSFLGVLLGILTAALLLTLLRGYQAARVPRFADRAPDGFGSIRYIGDLLFRDYLLPFEATSVLILIAIIGVVVLAKRKP